MRSTDRIKYTFCVDAVTFCVREYTFCVNDETYGDNEDIFCVVEANFGLNDGRKSLVVETFLDVFVKNFECIDRKSLDSVQKFDCIETFLFNFKALGCRLEAGEARARDPGRCPGL